MINIPEIVGQDIISEFFERSLNGGRIPHAIIISGEKGSGKLAVAKAFAMEAIGTDTSEHSDIRIVEFPETSPKYTETIREEVVNDMQLMPLGGDNKFYIIKDAGIMTDQAQNALLKSLEEPPEYAHIVLLTDDAGKLLPTIRSRSVHLYIKPIEAGTIREFLVKEGIEGNLASVCSAFSMGNLNKAREYATNPENMEFAKSICEVFSGIALGEHPPLFYNSKITSFGKDVNKFIEFMEIFLRDVLVYKVAKNSGDTISPWKEDIIAISAKCSFDRLGRVRECLSDLRNALELKAGYDNLLHILFTEIGGNE